MRPQGTAWTVVQLEPGGLAAQHSEPGVAAPSPLGGVWGRRGERPPGAAPRPAGFGGSSQCRWDLGPPAAPPGWVVPPTDVNPVRNPN